MIQPPGNTTQSTNRERVEARTVSSQAPVAPNAAPDRAVTQVPEVEELPDGNMVNVEQAREVFAREAGGDGGRTPQNPLDGAEEATRVAATVREQIQSASGEALIAQASRPPGDAAALLRTP
ncbi:MAG: hypothetical protein U5S82_15980 [Gammaproteobacteria bacterium]|nr:hypothetical protein [Gammaproteobacteria bacterium]